MAEKQTWSDFRSAGLLWLINTFLHVFGWAIVVDIDKNGEVTDCYPARVKLRGFDYKSQDEGYIKITKYMKDNANMLLNELEE